MILPFLTKTYLPEIEKVSVIPRSGEKFMSLKLNNRITLLDSMNFLSGSLESLFENIKSTSQFKFISQSSLISEIDNVTMNRVPRKDASKRLKLLLMKGVYPYEFANSLKDFERPNLVERSEFFNSMTGKTVSIEQYQRAQNVWDTFEMSSMKEYMETYCMSGNNNNIIFD